jgi:DNA-binding response OmpR family regulator
MSDFHRHGVAIVIEAGEMVQMLCDTLQSFGYRVVTAPTHALAAERALAHDQIDLLAASVPAPDESRAGIYLEQAATRNAHMAVVLMLADPLEQSPDAPDHAVKIVKPFGHKTLIAAIELAEARANQN